MVLNSKMDNPGYGPFLRMSQGAPAARGESERPLFRLALWLARQDPHVLGIRLVAADDEAGGLPMIHIAFPLGHRRTRGPGAPFDPANPTIADLLGPEIAAGKRLNIQANGDFSQPFSYIRIPPSVLEDKIEGDRRRLSEAIQNLDREIRPVVAAILADASGEIDHATVAAPADWQERQWAEGRAGAGAGAIGGDADTPSTHDSPAPADDPARAAREYLASRGVKADTVAAIRITPFVRGNEPWLRFDIPRGGNLRGEVPLLLNEAGVRTMRNTKAATDEEILGAIYCKAAEVAGLAASGQGSMKEFQPRKHGRH
ncbi:hypothetical protein [Aquisphaera insulae]|uniref:hypothetical protein n=1 Tax=Aquisphaera insulae TaxID=2712864 RepID=UPI0013EDA467|nr:hypothetical protein [Aquisphaera insulae]